MKHKQIPVENGKRMGCSDGGPSDYSNAELSRALDFYNASFQWELQEIVWKHMPYDLKMNMLYSKWSYESL